MIDRGWQRAFDDPIPLPDAATFITKLPKREHDAPEWRAAIEAVMVVETGGPTMFCRIGIMQALNRHHVGTPRRKRANKYWIVL
jgi:hypothetical protein